MGPGCVVWLPNDTATREHAVPAARAFFASEAAALTNALWDALPGGAFDALLVALRDRQRAALRTEAISRG
jgi:hypothetical protein